MFNQFGQNLQSPADDQGPFNVSASHDPVARKTEWTIVSTGGRANFRTHKLVAINSDRMEFKATIASKLFSGVFLLIGLGGMAASGLISGKFAFHNSERLVPLLTGLFFAGVGCGALYVCTTPIVFDKRNGFFWRGRKAPDEVFDRTTLKKLAELKDIHALQLLSEFCEGKRSFYNYELNLVLHDGKRVNVIDHGNGAKLKQDVAALAAFLGKPVWNTT